MGAVAPGLACGLAAGAHGNDGTGHLVLIAVLVADRVGTADEQRSVRHDAYDDVPGSRGHLQLGRSSGPAARPRRVTPGGGWPPLRRTRRRAGPARRPPALRRCRVLATCSCTASASTCSWKYAATASGRPTRSMPPAILRDGTELDRLEGGQVAHRCAAQSAVQAEQGHHVGAGKADARRRRRCTPRRSGRARRPRGRRRTSWRAGARDARRRTRRTAARPGPPWRSRRAEAARTTAGRTP